MNRVFVDMDGVVVDFEKYMRDHGLTDHATKHTLGAYRDMEPLEGALEAVKMVISMGFDVWIATKPPTGVPSAYSDKVSWVMEHLPELTSKIIITHDKGLLGDEHDFLCDDRPERANCRAFKGTLLSFTDGYHWNEALIHLSQIAESKLRDASM
jgi:5'(3')-deoxyribonucleotidase